MKTSLKAYIDSLDLTPEEKAALTPVLSNEKVVGAIDKELSGAQSEFSRTMDEARKAKERNDAYYTDLQGYKATVDSQLTDARKQVEEGKVLTARVQERLRGFVADGDLTEDEVKDLLTASTVTPTPTPTPAAVAVSPKDDQNAVSRAVFEKTAEELMNFTPALMGIYARHQALYGKAPDPELISTLHVKALEGKKGINAMADEVFHFSDRQKELDKLAADERERQIRADERTKVTSELANPTHRPASASNSPVLSFSTPEKATTDGQNHRARGVLAAVEAFSQGKYSGAGA